MVQKYLSLRNEDIIFIATRSYQNSFFDNSRIIDLTSFDERFRSGYTKQESSQWIGEIDDLINKETYGMPFNLYVSTVGNTFKQVMASHRKCAYVEIIEEGVIAYMDRADYYSTSDERLSFIAKLWLDFVKPLIIGKRRAKLTSTYDMSGYKNNHFFGFFDGCYPRIPADKRVAFNEFCHLQESDDLNLSNEPILVMDAVAVEQQRYCSVSAFLAIFEKMLLQESAVIKESIHIKFHPSQDPAIVDGVRSLLERYSAKIKVIPNNIAIEEILIHSKNLIVLGYFSSLLFYARKMGHQARSYMTHFNHFPSAQDWMSSYPTEFIDEICVDAAEVSEQ